MPAEPGGLEVVWGSGVGGIGHIGTYKAGAVNGAVNTLYTIPTGYVFYMHLVSYTANSAGNAGAVNIWVADSDVNLTPLYFLIAFNIPGGGGANAYIPFLPDVPINAGQRIRFSSTSADVTLRVFVTGSEAAA